MKARGGVRTVGTGELARQMAVVEFTPDLTTYPGTRTGGVCAAGISVGMGSAEVSAGGTGVLGARESEQHD